MRAKRVSEGELVQADVEGDPIYDGDELVGHTVPEGHTGFINADNTAGSVERMCKACEKVADGDVEHDVVVAPTGMGHLDKGEGMTLCGRDASEW